MAPLINQAEHSLISQSQAAQYRNKPVNGDGFGVGWYPTHHDDEPAVFVSIEPAWSNRNLEMIAKKIVTKHYFAHVRDASANMPVNQANCHPFYSGQYLWMHNGRVNGFQRIKRALHSSLSDQSFDMLRGNTDSECLFALFMDSIQHKHNLTPEELQSGLQTVISTVEETQRKYGVENASSLNMAVTDGLSTIISRYSSGQREPASLYFGQGTIDSSEESVDFIKDTGTTDSSTIICSEPLSDDQSFWSEVPQNSIITLYKGHLSHTQIE